MFRDLFLKLLTFLEAIKTAVETIAVNTTPADDTEPADNTSSGET